MNFTRRKFLQITALVCAAPVINKIDGIAMVNIDSCVPVSYPHECFNFIQDGMLDKVTGYIIENRRKFELSKNKET